MVQQAALLMRKYHDAENIPIFRLFWGLNFAMTREAGLFFIS